MGCLYTLGSTLVAYVGLYVVVVFLRWEQASVNMEQPGQVNVVSVTVVQQPVIITGARYRLRMAMAIIGAVIGYSVAVCLGGYYRNASTAVYAAMSGIFATLTFLVHYNAFRDRLRLQNRLLTTLMIVGFVFCVVGVISIAAFIGLAAYLRQGNFVSHDSGVLLLTFAPFI